MQTRSMRLFMVPITILIVSTATFAQGGAATNASAPKDFDPHDLSGVWRGGGEYMGTPPPPMTPWGKAKFDATKPSYGPRAVPPAVGNDPLGKCDPQGYPRYFFYGVREYFMVPGRMLQLFEWGRALREVYLDGTPLPEDPFPRWLGWSSGHWEGDTLVVNSIGFDDRTWLDHFGNPHSDEMKIEERYRRVDKNTIELRMKIDDPKTYTKPWESSRLILKLQPPDFKIREEFCSPSEEEHFNKGVRDPAGGITNK